MTPLSLHTIIRLCVKVLHTITLTLHTAHACLCHILRGLYCAQGQDFKVRTLTQKVLDRVLVKSMSSLPRSFALSSCALSIMASLAGETVRRGEAASAGGSGEETAAPSLQGSSAPGGCGGLAGAASAAAVPVTTSSLVYWRLDEEAAACSCVGCVPKQPLPSGESLLC